MITIAGVVVLVLLYVLLMKVAEKAIEADERRDKDFGYHGRYSRLDSWQ